MAESSAESEKGTALQVWKNEDHDFYYPDAVATIPEPGKIDPANSKGQEWNQKQVDLHLTNLTQAHKKWTKSNRQGKFPIRTKLTDLPSVATAQQTILTNHFELNVFEVALYEYEIIDLEVGGQTRKKIQALFRKAIAQWSFLKDDQDSFATDGQKTIVSWKKLHDTIDDDKLFLRGPGKDGAGSQWQDDISTGRTTSVTARFNFVGSVNVEDLVKQTQCDLTVERSDLSSVERCINILISKSFDNSVVKLSGKKFYVRNARDTLGQSQSLEIIRGYYYAVQPSIGRLLMNFNVATSAFIRPILVSEFLQDTSTFSDLEKLSLLTRLRVYVEREHKEDRLNRPGARIKKISALGNAANENIEDLYFHKKLLGADQKPYKLPNNEWARETKKTFVAQHHLDGKFTTSWVVCF
jgi:eukaryotic translation initiation factor 2C